MYTSKEGKSH